MANGPTHSLVGAVTVGTDLGWSEKHCGEQSAKPIAGAVLAGGLTKLPDILEPARHPHHRQFFHSLAFAGLLGWGASKVYEWQPEHPVDKAIRFVLLVGAASYMVHLALDACTSKSLPLLGKI